MPEKNDRLIAQCENIINAYQTGQLGVCELPEDNAPAFAQEDTEARLAYFTLPMALNYRRNSTQAWNAARATWEDDATSDVFSVEHAAQLSLDGLQELLVKHKLALQPNRLEGREVLIQELKTLWRLRVSTNQQKVAGLKSREHLIEEAQSQWQASWPQPAMKQLKRRWWRRLRAKNRKSSPSRPTSKPIAK